MKKARVYTALILCCLFGGIYTSQAIAVNAEGDVAALYEEALIKFENDELSTAVIHLKNILKQDPDHMAAHLLLGQAYIEQGEGALAERELNTARQLGADRALVTVHLGKAYKLQRKYRQILDDIREGDFHPGRNSEILVQRGEAYLELRDTRNSELAYRKASKLNPDSTAPLLGLIAVNVHRGDFDGVDEVMQQAIDLNPSDPEVWHTKGSVAHAQHNFEEALTNYKKALALKSGNFRVQVAIAGAYMDTGRYQEALKVLDGLVKEEDKAQGRYDPQIPYLRGVIYSHLGDAKASSEAMVEASIIMSKLPTVIKEQHLETLLLSALIDHSMNRMDEAYTSLETYVRRVPGNPGARKLMGSILFNRGKYDQAIKALKPAVAMIPNDYQLLTMLGTAYLKKGRHLRAIEFLDKAAAVGGDAVEARTQLAMSRLAQGNSEVGLKQLSEVFSASEEARLAGVTLVMEHLKRKQDKQAVKIAALLSERHPENMNLLNLLASTEIAAGDIESATRHLEQILKQDDKYLPAILNLAKIDIAFGRVKQARTRIDQAAAKHPDSILVIVERARLEEALGNKKDALELMRKAVARNEQSANNNLYLGEMLARQGLEEELKRHLMKMERLFPDNIQVMRMIGATHLSQGNPTKARTLFRRMSKLAGYNAQILMDTSELLIASGDLEGATWSLMKVLEDSPDSAPALVSLAAVQIADNKLDSAASTIGKLMQSHAENPLSHSLQARLHMVRGEFSQAIKYYNKAISLGGSQNTALQLFQAYIRSGDIRSGVTFLEQQIKTTPQYVNTNLLKLALAEGYLHLGNLNSAGEVYEQMIQSGVNDANVYNNLANIYFKQGNSAAVDIARKAHELAPESPHVNDTLGWLLVNSGKAADGLRYLRNASLRASANKTIRYHIASALVELGRKDEAKKELRRLLAAGEKFDEYGQARALLDSLSAGK